MKMLNNAFARIRLSVMIYFQNELKVSSNSGVNFLPLKCNEDVLVHWEVENR